MNKATVTLTLEPWFHAWLQLHLERVKAGVYPAHDPRFARFILLCAIRAERPKAGG